MSATRNPLSPARIFVWCRRMLPFASVAPEAAIVAAGQVAAALGTIAMVRVLTGLLRPAAYGEVALGMTALTLVNQLVMGPVGTAAIRFYAPSTERRQIGTYARAVIVLAGAGSLLLLSIALIGGCWIWLSGHRSWIGLLCAAAAHAWLASISSVFDGIQNAARQRAIVAMHQAVGAWLRIGLIICAFHLWRASASLVLWTYAASYVLIIVSQSIFLLRTLSGAELKGPCEPLRPLLASMASYIWPFCTWGIFTWMQASADRWALTAYTGLHQAGLYQSLYQIALYPSALVTQFLLQVCTPIVFAKAGDGRDPERRRAAERFNDALVGLALVGTLLIGLVSYLGGHKLLAHLLAPVYRADSALLTTLILAGGCFCAGQIACLNLMTTLSTHRLILPKIVTALAGSGLIIAGAIGKGTSGVAAAQLCFGAGYVVWILCLTRTESAAIVAAARPAGYA